MNPLVSIYLPTQNRHHLLKRAIESALRQTYPRIEIVVCSDGSTDETDQLMAGYERIHRNVIYLKNPSPLGACATRNKAIFNCHGQYVTGLDDDDFFLPDRIQKFVDETRKYGDGIYFSGVLEFRHFGVLEHRPEIAQVDLEAILKKNYVGNQVFVPTQWLQSINGFSEDLPAWQDMDAWIRLVKAYSPARALFEYNYVMDKTHCEERISENPNNITSAFSQFCEKHDEYKKIGNLGCLASIKLNYINVESTSHDWKMVFATQSLLKIFILLFKRNMTKPYFFLLRIRAILNSGCERKKTILDYITCLTERA
jgi:glycosyltransferase involved in cell wall biosynthesis